MKFKNLLIALILCFFVTGCVCAFANERNDIKKINDSMVRFHIIANSDSERDQDVKMACRKYLFENINLRKDMNKQEVLNYFEKNQKKIKNQIDDFLYENHESYKCSISIVNDYFPVREYNDFTLPSGYYDAVRVKLGKAKGQNYFCVMYPSLCMIDSVSEKTDAELSKLKPQLDNVQIDMIDNSENKTVIKFKLIEIIDKFL